MSRHKKVIVVLGVAPVANTINNPLDFESRKQMLMSAYPGLTVLYVKDVNDDLFWSSQLDSIITDVKGPTQSVLLYGSRDSFIDAYCGRFDTYELPTHHVQSGTSLREQIGKAAHDSPEWRAGVIWASRNRFPTSFQVVDIAIFNRDHSHVLLGHKPGELTWRLIGGFADPDSETLEDDARREVMEEAGVRVHGLEYVGSFTIDDWRYRGEPDSMKSALFIGWTDEEPSASDDIDDVKWVAVEELDPTAYFPIMDNHRPLVTKALMAANRHWNTIQITTGVQ